MIYGNDAATCAAAATLCNIKFHFDELYNYHQDFAQR